MTTTIDTATLKGSASFKRTIQTKQYETATAELWVEFELGDPDTWATALKEHENLVKASVLDSLELPYDLNEQGVIVEPTKRGQGAVETVFPGATAAAAPSASAAPAAGDDSPPFPADTQDKGERAANKEWAIARFETHPNDFWDNRQNKRNPKGPDLKHKSTGMGVWL